MTQERCAPSRKNGCARSSESALRILTAVDTFNRFSPAVVPRFSFRAPDVIEVLERVCGEVGYPTSIRVDQGS